MKSGSNHINKSICNSSSIYVVNVYKTNCINSVSGSIRLVCRADNPNKEILVYIPYTSLTINGAYITRVAENWYINNVVMSFHISGIMINNGVKSVYVSMVPVLISIRSISIRNDLSYKLVTQTENMNFPNDGQDIVMLG